MKVKHFWVSNYCLIFEIAPSVWNEVCFFHFNKRMHSTAWIFIGCLPRNCNGFVGEGWSGRSPQTQNWIFLLYKALHKSKCAWYNAKTKLQIIWRTEILKYFLASPPLAQIDFPEGIKNVCLSKDNLTFFTGPTSASICFSPIYYLGYLMGPRSLCQSLRWHMI